MSQRLLFLYYWLLVIELELHLGVKLIDPGRGTHKLGKGADYLNHEVRDNARWTEKPAGYIEKKKCGSLELSH